MFGPMLPPLIPDSTPTRVTSLAVGDTSRTGLVIAAIVLLVVIGIGLLLLARSLVRSTRAEPKLLARLEVMGDRTWRRADRAERQRMLEEARPAGAEPAPILLLDDAPVAVSAVVDVDAAVTVSADPEADSAEALLLDADAGADDAPDVEMPDVEVPDVEPAPSDVPEPEFAEDDADNDPLVEASDDRDPDPWAPQDGLPVEASTSFHEVTATSDGAGRSSSLDDLDALLRRVGVEIGDADVPGDPVG